MESSYFQVTVDKGAASLIEELNNKNAKELETLKSNYISKFKLYKLSLYLIFILTMIELFILVAHIFTFGLNFFQFFFFLFIGSKLYSAVTGLLAYQDREPEKQKRVLFMLKAICIFGLLRVLIVAVPLYVVNSSSEETSESNYEDWVEDEATILFLGLYFFITDLISPICGLIFGTRLLKVMKQMEGYQILITDTQKIISPDVSPS